MRLGAGGENCVTNGWRHVLPCPDSGSSGLVNPVGGKCMCMPAREPRYANRRMRWPHGQAGYALMNQFGKGANARERAYLNVV